MKFCHTILQSKFFPSCGKQNFNNLCKQNFGWYFCISRAWLSEWHKSPKKKRHVTKCAFTGYFWAGKSAGKQMTSVEHVQLSLRLPIIINLQDVFLLTWSISCGEGTSFTEWVYQSSVKNRIPDYPSLSKSSRLLSALSAKASKIL